MVISQKLPTFRSDLNIITRYDIKGNLIYVVRDPLSGEIFEFNEEDYFICKQLDGNASLPMIQSQFNRRFNLDVDTERIVAFVHKLEELGLLVEKKIELTFVFKLFQSTAPETWKRWKLFNPNRLLTWLAAKLQWCYTRTFVVASVIIFLLAVGVLYNNFSEFLKDLKFLIEHWSLFQILVVVYFFINILGEFARGVTSTRYGCRADEFGILLAFDIIPKFYCRCRVWELAGELRDKSYRSRIFFTPTYYSFLAASLGMLIWKMAPQGISLRTFGITLALAGTISAAIRLNILWPTDASYLLANWLEIPALRRRAIEVVKAWLFMRPLPEPLTSNEKQLFRWYGLLAGSVTLLSIAVGVYFLSKWLIHYLNGTGALILLFVVLVKYRRGLLWFKHQKMV